MSILHKMIKKQKASKGTLSLARRSLCLGGSVHGEDDDNTNDQLLDISHDYDHVKFLLMKTWYILDQN